VGYNAKTKLKQHYKNKTNKENQYQNFNKSINCRRRNTRAKQIINLVIHLTVTTREHIRVLYSKKNNVLKDF
jgi:hypothetical protein